VSQWNTKSKRDERSSRLRIFDLLERLKNLSILDHTIPYLVLTLFDPLEKQNFCEHVTIIYPENLQHKTIWKTLFEEDQPGWSAREHGSRRALLHGSLAQNMHDMNLAPESLAHAWSAEFSEGIFLIVFSTYNLTFESFFGARMNNRKLCILRKNFRSFRKVRIYAWKKF